MLDDFKSELFTKKETKALSTRLLRVQTIAMGREIRFKRNSRGSIALQDSMLTNNLAQAIIKSSDSSPISSNPLQASESDSSDDDATDYPYQTNGEYGTDVATMTRKPAAQKEDPGPSVRARTAAELDATIKAQVEDREHYIHSFSALQARAFANRAVKLTTRA